MALETNVLLKSILQNLYLLDTIEEARKAVEALLDKEDVALIREQTPKRKQKTNQTED